jgi:dihydroorotase
MRVSNAVPETFDTLIAGAIVVDAGKQNPAQVGIVDGHVAALLDPSETAVARTVIAADGCILLPGLVDAHAHMREPGLTHKEDFSSALTRRRWAA